MMSQRDLERVLQLVAQKEAAAKKKTLRRKFLVAEALYEKYGGHPHTHTTHVAHT